MIDLNDGKIIFDKVGTFYIRVLAKDYCFQDGKSDGRSSWPAARGRSGVSAQDIDPGADDSTTM